MSIRLGELTLGQSFEGTYVVSNVKVTRKENGKVYTNIEIKDDVGGTLSGMLWDTDRSDLEGRLCVVKVIATVTEYINKNTQQRTLQMDIKNFEVVPTDEVPKELFKRAPYTKEELKERLLRYLNKIENKTLRTLVHKLWTTKWNSFLTAPAAKSMHHDYISGLAYHTLRMLQLGEFLCMQRPFLRKDLVFAGISCHDYKKVDEMVSEMGIVSDYSTEGKLFGHIVMVSLELQKVALQNEISLEDPDYLELQHIVLSHHGKEEWGSPVKPKTPEAIAVHWIDQLDAKMQMVEDNLMKLGIDQEWTGKVFGLDNVELYRRFPDNYIPDSEVPF